MLRYWEHDYEGNDFANEDDDFPELTDSDSDSDEISPGEAGIQLCELLINLYMTGILSAKTFSIICHWCKLAGVSGPVGDLGSPPGRESGNYQKTLDGKLGFKKHDARGYKFVAPGHHKYDISRTMHENFVIPPHESLRDEVADNPEVLTKLAIQLQIKSGRRIILVILLLEELQNLPFHLRFMWMEHHIQRMMDF